MINRIEEDKSFSFAFISLLDKYPIYNFSNILAIIFRIRFITPLSLYNV